MKKTYGIYEVKANLSKIIRHIQKQHLAIEITDRGRPVAMLSPLVEEEKSLDQRMTEFVNEGVITFGSDSNHLQTLKKVPGALARFLMDRD